jgi:hypothetical protein
MDEWRQVLTITHEDDDEVEEITLTSLVATTTTVPKTVTSVPCRSSVPPRHLEDRQGPEVTVKL